MPGFNSPEIFPLFEQVQMSRVFPDGKTFVDCQPKFPEREIALKYKEQKNQAGFSLKQFVLENYKLPVPHSNSYHSDSTKTAEENIECLWDVLTRQPDTENGSLIPLPHPYIVPGGRFGEIYYWDSYFTMLGLRASGKTDMIENMVKNFAHLVDTVGYIPNGNRIYYLGRSQPPFFSLMVHLLAEIKGKQIVSAYCSQLETEYRYWMKGIETLTSAKNSAYHTARMPDGEILNRFWDEQDTPRPESYREDVELAHSSGQKHAFTFRHLRAGAESGWDFSSRWFRDGKSFSTIHTIDIIPVDLNCLLYHLEQAIAEAYAKDNQGTAAYYHSLAENRKAAIRKYCWNKNAGFYTDYDLSVKKQKEMLTLAGATPLFFNIATDEQSGSISRIITEKFLLPGGVVTTLENTGQQWDAPNGWAPLQWITIKGLENYGFTALAKDIALRWIKLNEDVFKRTGKLMEKYNVIDTHLEAGGGEYDGQDGFGWTNGVLLALIAKYGKP
ncbi:MAG: alpha,alpha-trehalase TreF [Bacteroidota bacterium]